MHLVIYFCGTGNPGDDFNDLYNHEEFGYKVALTENNTRTIFVRGCEEKEVCNSGIFPNLKRFSKRFVNKVFRSDENENLVLGTTNLGELGVGVNEYHSNVLDENSDEEIESITLCGYSRGAVTCFTIAKELNKIAPNVPVDIVANQPVPGNSYMGPGTNAYAIADCSNLENLQNVSVILASYTGIVEGKKNLVHRRFFSQILPQLPRRTSVNKELIVYPRAHHWQSDDESEYYMHRELVKILQKRNLLNMDIVNSVNEIIDEIESRDEEYAVVLPRVKALQRVFGLSKNKLYKNVDKKSPYLRARFVLVEDETIVDWWNKHEEGASRRSTKLTKYLVATINSIDEDSQDDLITLYQQAERWLLKKEGSSSSRYYQVTWLRNNLLDLLTDSYDMEKANLIEMSREILSEEHYFQNHWQKLSRAASIFKTDETRELDRAFIAHDKITEPGQEDDKTLMQALDQWLEAKDGSNSKRYDIVVQIREQLTQLLDDLFPSEITSEVEASI